MPARLVAVAAALLVTAAAVPAGAARAPGRAAVGGAQLGSRAVAVQPLTGAPGLPRRLSAASWLIADAGTGDVLAAKDAHHRRLPASTLKVLTAVALLPRLDPEREVRVTYDDAVVDGSKVGLVPGMRYTVDTLFTSLLVVSANDAANALADAAGGIRRSVALMNAQARRLQAYDTVARTPSGLDAAGESTSAYDLALIMKAGLAMPAFRHYIGVTMSHVPAPHHKRFQIYTHNRLLPTYRGMLGGKNGYTVKAAATYVGVERRHGHTIIVAMMHARPDFWTEAKQLLDWGFAAECHVIPVGTLVGQAEPAGASAQAPAPTGRATVVLTARRHSEGIASWQLAALAASAGIAVVVTARRQRRRAGRRLSLPPP